MHDITCIPVPTDQSEPPDIKPEIEALLDALAELQAQQDVIRLEKESLRESVLTPEIKQTLTDIDAEYADREADIAQAIAKATETAKAVVRNYGSTVTGKHLQAVYANGRVSWDTKVLDGILAVHPELAPFRKQGQPSVSIRKVGGKSD